MTNTSIPVSKEVQQELSELKDDDTTWNKLMKDLIDSYESEGKKWTAAEIEDIVDKRIEDLRR